MVKSSPPNLEQIASLVFRPLEWGPNLDLPPGTVLGFLSERTEIGYIFECTGLRGGRATSGRLTELLSGRVVATIEEAEVSLLHPIPLMAQKHAESVQFYFSGDDKSTKVTPAYSAAEIAFDPQLARQIFADEARRRELEPIEGQSAQSTIAWLYSYFLRTAESMAAETDYANARRYRDAAQLIGGLLTGTEAELGSEPL